METRVFKKIKAPVGDVKWRKKLASWAEFYRPRLSNPERYIEHLKTNYAPYFDLVAGEAQDSFTKWEEVTAARFGLWGKNKRSPTYTYLHELGPSPGFVHEVIRRKLTNGRQDVMQSSGFGPD